MISDGNGSGVVKFKNVVLMHLVVLGAFWHQDLLWWSPLLQVLIHLLVLGAFWRGTVFTVTLRLWAVLMHLVVLGAF